MDTFFNKIVYASSNEDGRSEIEALNITSEDTILSITGSGSRSLDLLLASPKKVISIDFNKTQNYLLHLKIAAYAHLEYTEFITLLGVSNDTPNQKSNSTGQTFNQGGIQKIRRRELFEQIKIHLPENSRQYFEENIHLISEGILFCGTWEKLNSHFHHLFIFKKKALRELFESRTLREQKEYWEKHFKTPVFKFLIKLLSARFLWIHIIREPGAKLIPKDFDVTAYILQRFDLLVSTTLLRESDFANFLFFGKYIWALPLHLQKENFDTIKKQVSKIEVIQSGLEEFVSKEGNLTSVTAMSLSDFGSYAPKESYIAIWNEITKNSQSGTKFCERQYLVKNSPELLDSSIQRNSEKEQEIEQRDNTGMYTFCIGTIQKSPGYSQ